MFDGKMKALTFSYDDGVTQDIRFIELLNKYNLKCTFNLSSDLLGEGGALSKGKTEVTHIKVPAEDVASIYKGHEVAVHTLTHPHLYDMEEAELIRQVEVDRQNLSRLVGYEVDGMAYPFGDCDERIKDIIRRNTGVKYSRTTIPTYDFEPQTDLLGFKPTIHNGEWDKLFELGEKFLEMQTDRSQIFYVWGHTYEFDFDNSWDRMEKFFKLMSNRDDIFYGTNREILL